MDDIFSLIECEKIIEITESIGYEKEIIKHIIHIYNIILIPIANMSQYYHLWN